MNCIHLCRVIGILLFCFGCSTPSEGAAPLKPGQSRVRALLVGCSDYVQPGITDLPGAENDVRNFHQLLISKFRMSEDRRAITALVGRQATSRNITNAFENLVRTAQPGSQIVILLSGHGAQQKDQNHDEVDGYDEVFCPVDIAGLDATGTIATGGITDDQIGNWLKGITDRGASVWLIADACHTGTLTRGVSTTDVASADVPRCLLPRAASSDQTSLASNASTLEHTTLGQFEVDESHEGAQGRVVAFYAAPPTEKTFETTVDGQRCGLFTHTICRVLSQSTERLTYRSLLQRVHGEYIRNRRTSPIPQMETHFADTVVLGEAQLRGSDIQISKAQAGYRVNAGKLRGLTEGTILAVYSSADDKQPAGYVRVSQAESVRAVVEPCEFQGVAWQDPTSLPLSGFCEIVQSGFAGMRRLAVSIDYFGADGNRVPEATRRQWMAKLKSLAETGPEKSQLLQVVSTPAEADWIVRPASETDSSWLQIAPTERFMQPTDKHQLKIASPLKRDSWQWLGTKLTDIARSCNLIEIAQHELSSGSRHVEINVELRALKNADDYEGVPFDSSKDPALQPDAKLHPGDLVGVQLTNPNPFPVYATVLFVNGQFHTEAFFPQHPGGREHRLAPAGEEGSSIMPVRLKIDDQTTGLERLITIAVKEEVGTSPDFTFLASTTRSKSLTARSPLQTLMDTAVYQPETLRHMMLPDRRDKNLDPHAINVISWVTLPQTDDSKGLLTSTGPAEDLKAKIVVEQQTRYHTMDRTRAVLGSYGRLVKGNRWLRRPSSFDPYGSVLDGADVRRWQTPFRKEGNTTLAGLHSFTANSEQWRLSGTTSLGGSSVVDFAMAAEHLRKSDVIRNLNNDPEALSYFAYLRNNDAVPCVVLQNIVMSRCSVNGSLLWGANAKFHLASWKTPPALDSQSNLVKSQQHEAPLIRCYLMHEVVLQNGRVIELKEIRP